MPCLFSIIESPEFPNLTSLCGKLRLEERRFSSTRKAIQALKTKQPDVVVADFVYGYGNNYAGVNISNLDVFLYSLQKYAPRARVVVLVDKSEHQYVEKLNDIVPLHAILQYPLQEDELKAALG